MDGATCDDAGECESRFCVDGVCCRTDCGGACRSCAVPGKQGTCTLVPEGVKHRDCADQGAETCGFDGTCDGLGTCRRHPAGTLCAAGTCMGNSVTAAGACDGMGSCVMGPVLTCAPFGCDPSGPAAHCFHLHQPRPVRAGAQCVNNSCGKKLPGAMCVEGGECASGFCIDGVCCESKCDGPCVSCALVGSPGVCRPVAPGVKDPRRVCADQGVASCGTSGSCDGTGGCARYAAGTVCKPPSCMGIVETTPGRCDGTGKCLEGGPLTCNPFACSASTGVCLGTCSRNEDCAPGMVCQLAERSCGKKGLGQPCQTGTECGSTFCVDKVCCQNSCQGPCRSCALGSSPGTCDLTLPGAPDPRGACKDMGKSSCGTDGTCNGNGACRRYPPATQCAAGTCNPVTNVRTLPSVCDANGACLPGAPAPCSPYRCNGSACFAGLRQRRRLHPAQHLHGRRLRRTDAQGAGREVHLGRRVRHETLYGRRLLRGRELRELQELRPLRLSGLLPPAAGGGCLALLRHAGGELRPRRHLRRRGDGCPQLSRRHPVRAGRVQRQGPDEASHLRRQRHLPGQRDHRLRPLHLQPRHQRLLPLLQRQSAMLLRQALLREQLVQLTFARLLVLAAALLSATAQAAPKRPPAPAAHDPKQEKVARAHFDRAEKAFNLGNFDAALAGYQAAYEALPLPAFLFNIAQCHRNLRNREQAVFFYQRYLSLAPDAPNRGVVQELIAEQKRLLEYEQPAEPDDKRVDLNARPEPTDPTVASLDERPAEDRGKWKKARWYLLGALGVALIGGVALLSVRRSGSLPTGELGAIDTR